MEINSPELFSFSSLLVHDGGSSPLEWKLTEFFCSESKYSSLSKKDCKGGQYLIFQYAKLFRKLRCVSSLLLNEKWRVFVSIFFIFPVGSSSSSWTLFVITANRSTCYFIWNIKRFRIEKDLFISFSLEQLDMCVDVRIVQMWDQQEKQKNKIGFLFSTLIFSSTLSNIHRMHVYEILSSTIGQKIWQLTPSKQGKLIKLFIFPPSDKQRREILSTVWRVHNLCMNCILFICGVSVEMGWSLSLSPWRLKSWKKQEQQQPTSHI